MFKINQQRIAIPALIALAAMAPLPANAQSRATTPIDSIVALVDEDVILRSELDVAVAGKPCRRCTCSNGRCWNG